MIPDYKNATSTLATALASQRQSVEGLKALSLIVSPENPIKAKQLSGDPVAYYKALGKLDDDDKIILAMQKTQDVNKMGFSC